MVKKLLLFIFLLPVLLLKPLSGYGQSCPDSTQTSSVTISTPQSNICAGEEITFTGVANFAGANPTFEWLINGSTVVSETASTLVTSALTATTNKVVLKVTTDCTNPVTITSNEITITTNPNRTPSVTLKADKTSLCPSETITFTANHAYGGTNPQYEWYINSNTTVSKTGATAAFSASDFNPGDNTVRVVLTSNFSCVTSTTAEAVSSTFTIRDAAPATPGAITGSLPESINVCPNTSLSYSIVPVENAAEYIWTLPNGWVGTSTSNQITVTTGNPGSGTISVIARNSCGDSSPQTLTVNIKAGTPAVPGNISGKTEVCPGVSETYSITAVPGAEKYIWTLPDGTEQITTSTFIDVTTNTSGSSNISVRASNSCGTSSNKTLSVSVKPGTPITPAGISGTVEVCPGTTETYTVSSPVAGATEYIWTLPTGWTGTSTTSSITVTTGTAGGNITVKAANDCGTSEAFTQAVNVKAGTPGKAPSISGASTVCPGTPETFSITPISGATSYTWTLPSGWEGTSTSEAINVTTGTAGGEITVKANNDCGIGEMTSMTITVSDPAPVMTGAITGPEIVCAGTSGMVYTIPPIENATSYIWTLPSGWVINGANNGNSVSLTPNSNSGNISVIAENGCGKSSTSTPFVVTSTTGPPTTPGTITTDLPSTAICPPLNNVHFSINEISNATGYNWILPAGWEIVAGENTTNITVNITANAKYLLDESVSVEATNVCGKSAASTLSGIDIGEYVITDLGEDQVLCKSTTTITLSGYVAFGSKNSNLKIASIISSGTNQPQNKPSGNVNEFSFTYTPSIADLEAGQVTFTVITEKPGGACDAGKDQMTVFFKPLPTASITAVTPVCQNNTTLLTFTGTSNSQVTYKKDGGANRTIVIDASGTASVETEALTANSTFSLVSAVNLDTPACTASLTGIAPAIVTVTPRPTLSSFLYADTPFCSSNTTLQTPTITGTNEFSGGTYTSTAGLSIIKETGEINPSASTPGTYIVTYATPASGGCESVTATTEITITDVPTASISYGTTPFCTSDTNPQKVALTGTNNFSGGIFSAPAGLTIDPATGDITAGTSTAGTYTVSYSTPVAGGCGAVVATTEVTITTLPTATIIYEGLPFCASDATSKAVILTGTDAYSGGIYSAPAGLTINASSGAIDPSTSTPGNYLVTYTIPASSGCGEGSATTEIIITETPAADISYSGPYCTSDDTLQPVIFSNTKGAYQGGSFTSTPAGLSGLDATTGAINPKLSSPGSYTVSYEIPGGQGCPATEITASVTISQSPDADLSYPSSLCNDDSTVYPPTFSNGIGGYLGGTFSGSPGLSIDPSGNVIASSSTPGIHTITYTFLTPDGCGPSEISAQMEIFEKPLITSEPQNLGICSSNPASFEVTASGDNLTYQWWYKPVNGTFATVLDATSSTLSFSNATSKNAGEYYVVVSGSSTCSPVQSETVTLNVDEEIVIIKPTEDQSFCDEAISTITFEFVAHANNAPLSFTWIKDGGEIIPDNVKYTATVSSPVGPDGEYTGQLLINDIGLEDNGVYAVRIDGPDYFTCSEATSKTFTLNINPLPPAPTTEPVTYCKGDIATPLFATGVTGATYKWYGSEFGDDYISEGGPVPSTVVAGTTSYWVSQKTDACESPRTELIVTVLEKPEAPSTSVNVNHCFGATTEALTATGTIGATINWYDTADSSTPLTSAPIPNSGETGTTSYWVSQTTPEACESDRVEIIVTIDPLPNTSITADQNTICSGSSTILHATGGETFTWTVDGVSVGTGPDLTVSPTETTVYKVTGANSNGCQNFTEFTLNVDQPTVAGTLAGPESVCVSSPNGTIELTGNTGEVIKWEYKAADASEWTAFTDGNLTTSRTFQNLTKTTSFRATVKNGICAEATAETTVRIDPLPEGGILAFDIADFQKDGRIFLTCLEPEAGYAVDLELSEHVGEIVAWKYRPSTSSTTWSTVMINGEPFTGTKLLAADIEALNLAQTVQATVFTVEIKSGACAASAYSKTALFSVIPADIEPAPVTVEPAVICINDSISLSSESGYSTEGGNFKGGAFDNAGIVSDGWKFTNLEGGENDFSSAADNGRPDHWLRTTPKDKFFTADINSHVVTPEVWDSKLLPEGNDGFAIVTGDNASLMETPVFTLDGLDEAILTFDQAYNLTEGDVIIVEISTNGGLTYDNVLFEMAGPSTSGYYSTFGDGTPESRPLNKMVLDLGAYIGLPNLRIRFNFKGMRDGAVWAVDNIIVPDGPQDAQLIWYYDDPSTPPGDLQQIGQINQEVVPFVPEYIGWNSFQVQTELILDSAGNTCHSLKNQKDVQVFVYDKYTIETTETAGTCGSNTVELRTVVTGLKGGIIGSFPTKDGFIGQWKITDLEGNPITTGFELTKLDPNSTFGSAINDPNVLFTAEELNTYVFTYELVSDDSAVYPPDYFIDILRNTPLVNPGCLPELDPITVEIIECSTLDFDGTNDYVDLGTSYTADSYSIEAWIRPFAREKEDGTFTDPTTGTIISGPNFEIEMADLAGKVATNDRWYHIAVTGGKLFIDGIESGAAGSGVGGDKALIGARWNNSSNQPENYFSGWIEEVRIWNSPLSQDEIRFMMNQRIKLVGTPAPTTVVDGEVVPVKDIGSYMVDSEGYNLWEEVENDDEITDKVWYKRNWGNLVGYYRLISAVPDPAGHIDFDASQKPAGGMTPNFADPSNPGRLHNMETHQENTSPQPYISLNPGKWTDFNTWLRPDVWDIPNGYLDGSTEITWNIVKTRHDITSDQKDIEVLGLIVEAGELGIFDPMVTAGLHWENPGQELRITHYLKLIGNIDLNGESQLLQNSGSVVDPGSTGQIEIDQQGTKSSYNYNYWTSPVSPGYRHLPFTISGAMKDGTFPDPKDIRFGYPYHFADAPVTDPVSVSSYWLYKFNGEAYMYARWIYVGQDGPVNVGEGYSMKGTDGNAAISDRQNYTFKGLPNNGDFTLKIKEGDNYLIGNPYPSALDARQFILDNLKDPVGATNGSNVFNGTLYFWSHFAGHTHYLEQYVGGYALYNLSGGVRAYSSDDRIDNSDPNRSGGDEPLDFIPVGQAFYINTKLDATMTFNAKIEGGSINFKNSQRAYQREMDGNSVFHSQVQNGDKKNKEARQKIWLKFQSPEGFNRQLLVTADPVTTDGFDIGYDAPLAESNKEDMYWIFDGGKFVIQGVAHLNVDRELPLGIKVQKEEKFTISIDKLQNFEDDKPIYLKDSLLGVTHNLRKGAYEATAPAGVIDDRFKIVFRLQENPDPEEEVDLPDEEDEVAEENEDVEILTGIELMYLRDTKEIIIRNPQLINVQDMVLNNLLGQEIHEFFELPLQKEVKLPVKRLSSGVYVVKLRTEKGVLTKKIILE